MATGTGKTYTTFQILWWLWKAGRKKRILFLADRNVLVDQTIDGRSSTREQRRASAVQLELAEAEPYLQHEVEQ